MESAAGLAIAVGAIGSLGFMFTFGRHAPPFLIVIFTFWVASPYVMLWWANRSARQWNPAARRAVHFTTFLVAIASLAVYAYDTFGPPHPQAARMYTAVPPLSWLVSAAIVGVAKKKSG